MTHVPYRPKIPPPPTLEEVNALLPRSEQASIPKSVAGTGWPHEGVGDASERQVADTALRVLAAYAARMKDGLALYRPLPGEATRFHESTLRSRLVFGSNRAGKTLTVSAEVSRIARGMDPYKKRADKNLKIMAVGYDEEHIADAMFSKLWWPGAFSIVRDLETNLWRAVSIDPCNPKEILPSDMERKAEWRPSPPMFDPAKTDIVWQKKGRGVPKLCEFPNGSRIQWHTSKGAPRKGIDIDLGWIDEETENQKWLPELQARLVDRDGALLLSFTPQASTPQYFDLHTRIVNGDDNIDEFSLFIEDNPYLPASAKLELYNDFRNDPDELAIRYYGQWAITQRRIYSTYDPDIHCIEPCQIPDEWMRILAVDPGTRFSGCLFLAVPPEEHEVHAYAEVFIRNSDAQKFAEAVDPYVAPYQFETFIIDMKAGMQTPMGFSKTVAEHYAEEFGRRGLMSSQTSDRFEFGSALVDGREYSLKRWLNSSPPILRIHKGRCSHLDRQLRNRFYDKNKADKREERTEHELVDALEYGCAWFDKFKDNPQHPSGLFYRAPRPVVEQESDETKLHSYFVRKKRERESRGRVYSIRLGSRSMQSFINEG